MDRPLRDEQPQAHQRDGFVVLGPIPEPEQIDELLAGAGRLRTADPFALEGRQAGLPVTAPAVAEPAPPGPHGDPRGEPVPTDRRSWIVLGGAPVEPPPVPTPGVG